ncbi:DUF6274 family protein [Streptomyces sp. NPDC087219]|uniref:DUF6274 family protein n=1 Tax=Streptomyces sp. NPDC087219 TaxID=3365770 RepID=UPI00380FAC26
MAAASAARHETRALLRAHLAAASRYGHLTRHCAVCHRLLRLSMDLPEPEGAEEAPERPEGPREGPGGGTDGPGEPAGGSGDESPTDP